GTKIVYKKIASDALRTNTWTRDTGIYWISANGGEPELITKQGSSPHFGKDNDRIYYVETDGSGKDFRFILNSIELDGSDERTLFSSKKALEYIVSPDSKLLAFQEGYNAYVMPFTLSGRKIEIGPDNKSLPIKKVSADAGSYLHFSDDSKKLHFSVGPKLFTTDLEGIFDYHEDIDKDNDKDDIPESLETNLTFQTDADVPTGTIALVGGRIITMNGDEVISSGTVIIKRNRIKAVGSKDKISIPFGAIKYDVSRPNHNA
ncbi:unnamed protein product, partial [marine sediment metagenome]